MNFAFRTREEDEASLDMDDFTLGPKDPDLQSVDSMARKSQILGYMPMASNPHLDQVTATIDNKNEHWKPAKVRRKEEEKMRIRMVERRKREEEERKRREKEEEERKRREKEDQFSMENGSQMEYIDNKKGEEVNEMEV